MLKGTLLNATYMRIILLSIDTSKCPSVDISVLLNHDNGGNNGGVMLLQIDRGCRCIWGAL